MNLLTTTEEKEEILKKNVELFKTLMSLSVSDIVRLQEIHSKRKQDIRTELEYLVATNSNNVKVTLEHKRLEAQDILLDEALDKKYNELFQETRF